MFNWLAVLVAAFVPVLVGFIWYNPKVFGNAWMKAAGITHDSTKGANMPLLLGLSFFFSFLVAMSLNSVVIHQMSIYSLLANETGLNDPSSDIGKWLADFNARFGDNFRTFKHGALHGTIMGLFFALPVIGTGALYERRGFRYIAIATGYWVVSLAIMGGIICGWK